MVTNGSLKSTNVFLESKCKGAVIPPLDRDRANLCSSQYVQNTCSHVLSLEVQPCLRPALPQVGRMYLLCVVSFGTIYPIFPGLKIGLYTYTSCGACPMFAHTLPASPAMVIL